MNDLILEVRALQKSYGRVMAVDSVSFDLCRGEVLALLGPSGCGKSTTLRLVAGLEEPEGGEIKIRGKTVASASRRVFVSAEKRNLGLVFQSYAIWPHMTVGKNIAYPLEIRGFPRAKIQEKVEEVLNLVGLGEFGMRRATQLSGGQQQRVALARALAYEPDILLLDEPLSNLDAKLRAEMRLQLKALQRRLGMTILYVTHDQVEAMSLANRVAVMRQGKIEQLGTPLEVYESPASFFVQSFVGRVLTLPVVLGSANGTVFQIDVTPDSISAHHDSSPNGNRVRLAIRPEDVTIEPLSDAISKNGIRGIVEDLIYCGDHIEYVLRVGETQLLFDTSKDTALERGQEVVLRMNAERVKTWPASDE
ncbi:MAG: ABC transporter ATP-binding protein [Candidatus Tectomicrobia bacterium]|uniref:ABC transporter ATP-binding protein n=1 Tax=Tectimicrobiota bacterium TaxID=2528274 RepID=A0A932GNZ1_UNCTE|nr:ABC transporter ATP-binding protein [Candidatus Tectomicrobia bacterium]